MTNRRDFLHLSGMGLLAAAIPEFPNVPAEKPMHHLSVQLYTIRDEISKDIRSSLKRLADIGYKNVETAFLPDTISVQHAADLLKEFGLNVSSSHVEIPTKDNISTILNRANTYGSKRLIWHGWPEDKRYSSLAGTKELIKIYNKGNQLAKDNGLIFGLHNHWWEYKNRVGGKFVYEILNEELSSDIFFETDIYWVKVAGQNPADIIKKLSNRIQLLHVKDGAAIFDNKLGLDDPAPMTPVGQGTLDIPGILNACSNQVEWLVVELDKSTINVFDALKQSFDYLSKFESVAIK